MCLTQVSPVPKPSSEGTEGQRGALQIMELLQQGMPGICAEAVSWEKVATASDVDGNRLD